MNQLASNVSCCVAAIRLIEGKFYISDICVWPCHALDETGCECQHMIRKYGYIIQGIPLCDQCLLLRGKRCNAIPILSLEDVNDVYLAEGTINSDRFVQFVKDCLVPHLVSFNGINPRFVVVMDSTSIHHVEEVTNF